MKRNKIASALLSMLLVISLAFTSANADLIINGTGSGAGGGSGSGSSTAWSSGAYNSTGYRLSVYFAPVAINSTQENPTYDWELAAPVGRTIDIKAKEANDTGDRNIAWPQYWGTQSVWDYLDSDVGGSYGNDFEAMSAFPNNDYYYLKSFSDYDLSKIDNKDTAYICLILNGSYLQNNMGVDYAKLDNDVAEVQSALNEADANIPDSNTNGKNAIGVARAQLDKSKDMLNGQPTDYLTLPVVFGEALETDRSFVKNGKGNSVDDLNNYLMHPTILNILGKATGGNFTATDFYMGKWYGDTDRSGEYTLGTYKIVVENLFILGRTVNGEKSTLSATLQDIIASGAMDNESNGSGYVGRSILGKIGVDKITNNMINTLRLSKGDQILTFRGTGMYMGQLLDDGTPWNTASTTADTANWIQAYAPYTLIGNACGLEVITSTAIGSYGITEQPKQSVLNLVSLSVAGERDSRLSNLQLYTDVDSLVNIRSAVTYDKFAGFVENGEAGYKAFAEAASGTTDPNNLQYVKALKINPHFQLL